MQLKTAAQILVYPTIKYNEYGVFFEGDDTLSSIYLAYYESYRFVLKRFDIADDRWIQIHGYASLEEAMDSLDSTRIVLVELSDLPANIELEGDKKFRLFNGLWHEVQLVKGTDDIHQLSLSSIQKYITENLAYVVSNFESKSNQISS